MRRIAVFSAAVLLAIGVFKESIHVLQIFSPTSPWAGLGLPVLIAVALCVGYDHERRRRRLLLLVFGVFFLAFSWYAQVVQGWRFVGSLVPLLLLPAAALGPGLARSLGPRRLELGTTALAGLMIVASLLDGAANFRPGRFTPTRTGAEVQAFLREHVGEREDVHYLLGPSLSLTCDWDVRVRGYRHRFPRTEREFSELLAGNDGARIEYALVAAQRAYDPRVGDTWVRVGPTGLQVAAPPPGWRLFDSIPAESPEVLIFQRSR